MIFPETSQVGVYEVRSRNAEGERLIGRFSVNLMSASESTIAPVADLELSAIAPEMGGQENVGQRELWPWFVVVALFVLMVEWWIYHRGARWPNREDWAGLTERLTG